MLIIHTFICLALHEAASYSRFVVRPSDESVCKKTRFNPFMVGRVSQVEYGGYFYPRHYSCMLPCFHSEVRTFPF